MRALPACSGSCATLFLISWLGVPGGGLNAAGARLPEEQPLWPRGIIENPIHYSQETVRNLTPRAHAPSGSNRVFSHVSEPSYAIHQAPKAVATGVGLVICPGGGYVDVWLDREGHDLAIWLKERGVTSLVLKYRTNARGEKGGHKYDWKTYLPAVEADAREAIWILRRQAGALGIDPRKIGIAGFSAGGHLALSIALDATPPHEGDALKGQPNFAGLFYPWLWKNTPRIVEKAQRIPPLFIINARDDRLVPASGCVAFYQKLLARNVKAELHIYEKGGHGFDLGEGRGASTALWKESFLAWLKDAGFVKHS